MISDKTDICTGFLQYRLLCAFSDNQIQQLISDITGIYLVLYSMGSLCVFRFPPKNVI